MFPDKIQNIVNFTDAESVLLALENNQQSDSTIISLQLAMSSFLNEFPVNVTLQWIPSHCGLDGNERADTLAKRGAACEQFNRPVSQNTAKQIIKANIKEEWMNRWAMGKTGRAVFQQMPRPNPKDAINILGRQDQVMIFRLRTQHIVLNAHLNRIQPEIAPLCTLCDHPYETVKHFLFECQPLQDLRSYYLPPNPDFGNTLYSNTVQLKQTCRYCTMAFRRRALAQMATGSVK